jgi:sodium/proline symporter
MQAIVMIFALVVVFLTGTISAGGISNVFSNIKQIPGFFEFFGIASPVLKDGVQQVSAAGQPLFGEAGSYGFITVISTLSWGLGYFGMPQVLLRFMAIRDINELSKSRRIATSWCVISLFAAVSIGLIGRTLYPSALLTQSDSESIFILMSTNLLPPLFAGLVMAGILAATISSADSYLLIATSAVAQNIYKGILKKKASDKEVMIVSRIILLLTAVAGVVLALDETSVIFKIVSFAWAGFGATFGPIMLFSLFWKKTTQSGAIAGMVAGGSMVFIWNYLVKPLGGVFGIYELLPAFIVSCVTIVIVSLLSKEPSQEIKDEFESAKLFKLEV